MFIRAVMKRLLSRGDPRPSPCHTGHFFSNSSRFLSSKAGLRLEGKVALITGAASGIGRATAREFVQNGAKVIIADIQEEAGKQAAEELGENADFVHCDVREEAQVSQAVDRAVSKHGYLDIMFNNAGISGPVIPSIADLHLRDYDEVMAVNVRGMVAGMKHAARVMVPRRQGCILCTASIAGLIGGVAPYPYSISKFAIPGLVKSVASELCKHGIRVNCISPYAVATPFVLDTLKQLNVGGDVARLLNSCSELKGVPCEVQDIAMAALFLSSDDGRFVTGHNLVVDGGFSVIKPFNLPTLP